jgi:hypothetical protein
MRVLKLCFAEHEQLQRFFYALCAQLNYLIGAVEVRF